MNVTLTTLDGRPVIKLDGNLTIDCTAAAKQKIVAAVVDAGTAHLDLSGIQDCDTAGVQLILMTRMDARARGLAFSAAEQSATFRAAAERIGIPANIFELSRSGVADRV